MSHTIELTDDQYATLEAVASREGATPEHVIDRFMDALSQTRGPIYFTDEELLRALGADDEEIAELAKLEWQADADE